MRKIILFLILISLQQLLAKEPTLEETFDFIYKKIALQWTNNDGKIVKTTSFSSFPDQRCTPDYEYKFLEEGDFPKWQGYNSTKINIKALDPSRVEIIEDSYTGEAFVYLHCKEDKECIKNISGKRYYKQDNISINNKIQNKYKSNSARIDVLGGKKRNALKVKKAFIHLIKLCGGTPELF